MPIYEFRCSECDTRFEQKRSAAEFDAPAPACPNGHAATRRVLSVFATAGVGASSGPAPAAGGGCGPGCACAANA
ncbi:MAG: FmdB family zinc ribbon protein [Acidimicrobiales bacterium]